VPGLTIVAGTDVDAQKVFASIASPANGAASELLVEIPNKLAIVWQAYDGYPRHVLREKGGIAILEGAIPGTSSVEMGAELRKLIVALQDAPSGATAPIERWCLQADGDFVLVVVLSDRKRLFVCTDALNRLPMYIRKSATCLTLAREIKMHIGLEGPGKPNRQALAETLALGFPLGGRTFIEDISYVAPASTFAVDLERFAVKHTTYRSWNLESLAEKRHLNDKHLRDLVDIFVSTCKKQSSLDRHGPVVLSLSGGNDSRSVLAGLQRAGCTMRAVTFLPARGADADRRLAKRIADAFGIEWASTRLSDPGWYDIIKAVNLRDGLNYAGIAHLVQFMQILRREYGSHALHFSGDGGDRALPDLRPPLWVRDTRTMVAYRFERAIWPLEEAAAFLRVSQERVLGCVNEHFGSLPEKSAAFRDIDYHIFDRGLRWLNEGEDRNRAFMWHQSPFYGQRFFEYAMSVHPDVKRGNALYARFLKALDPRAARIPTARWNAPLHSPRDRFLTFVESLPLQVPPPAGRAMYRLLRPLRAEAYREAAGLRYASQVEDLLNKPAVSEIFATDRIRDKLAGCSEYQFNMLVTQLLYVAEMWL
jgi:asparagine synthase (glutamine-hydrolysing)